MVRPSRRILPSVAAAQHLRNEHGPWAADLAPYIVEPLDMLGSRQYCGIVFVGPARTGKTFGIVLGGITYIVTVSPGDTLIVQMSQDVARDFSRIDLDKAIRNSPELAAAMSPRARDDNTFDKFFRSGMALKLGWPAVSQLSGKTLKYVFLTDYDRPENRDNIDGEGSMWDLAFKRVQTFMSRGKCLAESSPGDDWIDPKWTPRTPHEAPPARGILSLYNRGTMARWYWPCLHCRERMQAKPGTEVFGLPPLEELVKEVRGRDLMTMAEDFARIICPKCGGEHRMDVRRDMQRQGRWVHEGESIDAAGRITGERVRTNVASYWLGGAAAAYQRWDSMILGYLQAVAEYVRTGDESSMRTKINTDFSAPYLPVRALGKRKAGDLKQKAENYQRGVAPEAVRFITASVDIQSGRFVVHIFGWGQKHEAWLIDRFTLNQSPNRKDGDRPAALNPAVYAEDWDVIIREVVDRRIPLIENPAVTMPVLLTLCDSGGEDGVTQRAYEFWRSARDRGLGRSAMLVKGASRRDAPRVEITWPDSTQRGDRSAGAAGDVPVIRLNTTTFKDAIVGDLARTERGPGYIHLPSWADDGLFDEYVAEERTQRGYEKTGGRRNEAFDLHVYNRAACVVLGAEAIDWDNPPEWAQRPTADKEQPTLTPPTVEWRRGNYLR